MAVVQLCGIYVSGKTPMTRKLATLLSDKRAATTVEYGMICMTIVLAVIGAVRGVADETNGLWATVSTKTTEAMSSN